MITITTSMTIEQISEKVDELIKQNFTGIVWQRLANNKESIVSAIDSDVKRRSGTKKIKCHYEYINDKPDYPIVRIVGGEIHSVLLRLPRF